MRRPPPDHPLLLAMRARMFRRRLPTTRGGPTDRNIAAFAFISVRRTVAKSLLVRSAPTAGADSSKPERHQAAPCKTGATDSPLITRSAPDRSGPLLSRSHRNPPTGRGLAFQPPPR